MGMNKDLEFVITPVSGAIGADVSGIDVSGPLDQKIVTALNDAFLEHKVLAIRNQRLDAASLLTFSRLWGDVHFYPYMKGLPDQPEVFEIVTAPDAKRVFGNRWHSDQMYDQKPVKATLLFARELPTVGGDTVFSNLETAYDVFSDGMKAMLEKLRIHCDGADKSRYGGKSRAEWYADGGMDQKLNTSSDKPRIAVHPLIRTHPETGRKCLFLGDQVQRFDELTAEESQPLLDQLMKHLRRPEFTCRIRWEPGTLLIWDNRCTCHYAVADYVGHTRRMYRVTIAGGVPF